MANRVIKDSIWTSPTLSKLVPYYQDQWIRWLLLADDWGCFNADPDIIKGLAYPKRKETSKDILKIRQAFYNNGLLFIWKEEDREWGYFITWDKYQFCNATTLNGEGRYAKHRRKTPEPPETLLSQYITNYSDKFRQVPTKSLNPNPNPNPIPNPNPKENTGQEQAPAPSAHRLFSAIIDYLNKQAKREYRASSEKTKSLIRARLKEGFTEQDFRVVIDKKVEEWLGDSKMDKYLRPSTLFGTKFEDYLNQKNGGKREKKEDKRFEEVKKRIDEEKRKRLSQLAERIGE